MILNLLGDFQIYPFDDDLMLQLLKFACTLTKGIFFNIKGGNVKV